MRNCTSRRCKNEYQTFGNDSFLIITRKNGEKITVTFDTFLLDEIKKYHWQYTNAGYVRTTQIDGLILMHRLILGLFNTDLSDKQIDHIDGNTLNNKISNLRICTTQENCRNTHKRPNNATDGVIGVRKDIRCKNSWRAQIYIDKNTHIEKTFRDKNLAIEQRLKWELQYFGEFAPQIELIKSHYAYLLNKQLYYKE